MRTLEKFLKCLRRGKPILENVSSAENLSNAEEAISVVNEHIIKKETLNNIAMQSNKLVGKIVAVITAEIINNLTNINVEIFDQATFIVEIAETLGQQVGIQHMYPQWVGVNLTI